MSVIIKNDKVSPLQSMFLFVLHNSEPLSGADIVKRLEDDVGKEWVPTPGARYKILQFLEQESFIEKKVGKGEDPHDKRVSKYILTPNGVEMVAELSKQMKKVYLFLSNCCPEYCQ
ncbi:MAG: helix-turn-helix transcriptional regulator [Candidatus Hodarchaeales archaeon]|jgi:DNA-binding PadR family transcriptional regulator